MSAASSSCSSLAKLGRCPVIPDGGVRGIATSAHDPSVGEDADTSPRAKRVGRRAERYEPIIVTTLRRYVRRGAPSSLLRRIAGGAGHWRAVNQAWDIDGTSQVSEAVPRRRCMVLNEDLPELCTAERRIVLEQLAEECVETGAAFPTLHELADYFGCHWQSIDNDLRVLRRGQAVDWELGADRRSARRVMVAP